jgi:hypothetical protein
MKGFWLVSPGIKLEGDALVCARHVEGSAALHQPLVDQIISPTMQPVHLLQGTLDQRDLGLQLPTALEFKQLLRAATRTGNLQLAQKRSAGYVPGYARIVGTYALERLLYACVLLLLLSESSSSVGGSSAGGGSSSIQDLQAGTLALIKRKCAKNGEVDSPAALEAALHWLVKLMKPVAGEQGSVEQLAAAVDGSAKQLAAAGEGSVEQLAAAVQGSVKQLAAALHEWDQQQPAQRTQPRLGLLRGTADQVMASIRAFVMQQKGAGETPTWPELRRVAVLLGRHCRGKRAGRYCRFCVLWPHIPCCCHGSVHKSASPREEEDREVESRGGWYASLCHCHPAVFAAPDTILRSAWSRPTHSDTPCTLLLLLFVMLHGPSLGVSRQGQWRQDPRGEGHQQRE